MDEIRNHIMPTMYGAEVGFIAFLWLLTIIAKNNILPSVVFLITGLMIDKIYQEYNSQYKNNIAIKSRTLIVYYVMALSGLNIFYIVSGIRSALICSIFVWTYVKFYKTNRKWYYIISFLLGTVHIMSFMLLILVVVNEMIKKVEKEGRILVIFLIAFVGFRVGIQSGVIAFLASILPGSLGNLVYMKVISYGVVVNSQEILPLSLVINNVVIIFVLITSLYFTRKQDSLVFLLFFISIFGGLLETVEGRLVQATVLLMMPVLQINDTRMKRGVNYIYSIIIYFACLFSCFFSFYSLCAHTILNGVNYRGILSDMF